ncbi:hypothetical protein JTE90_007381 [Oedothorax gibbosus]|uniref:Uncharacterized protein n=1 Tax=Oedothorax gibbosus TaxID=931172 RepID=A0AAV6TSQ5_9ARAC|nr:hypothetical protein JTE90_007381 [Oedothorax gibbosus]
MITLSIHACGCYVSRLEDGKTRLLIFLRLPLVENTEMDWRYKTVSQKRGALGFENKNLPWPRGKGLGGSRQLNFFMYVPGNRRDYDTCEREGVEVWG